MLPHHQPLVVAEQFATLTAFAPGRVDLGLGRSPGFTPPVRRALRETERDFAADLAELRAYLTGTAEITLRPQPAGPRSEEHTSELQSRQYLVCRLLLEKKKRLPT